MKTVIIMQARMGSTRMAGKVLKKICGKTVLAHDIERLKQAKEVDEIIVATTTLPKDDVICQEALANGVNVFRGSEDDVLSRYFYAAVEFQADIIVRVTSDCPLIDPHIIDEMVQIYKKNSYNIVSNATVELENRTFPRGFDVEVFSMKELQVAFATAMEREEREHVTLAIYKQADTIHYYKNDIDYSKYRLTLDTWQDLEVIREIYKYLYHGKHDFYLEEIVAFLEEHPEVSKINEMIEQKKVKGYFSK